MLANPELINEQSGLHREGTRHQRSASWRSPKKICNSQVCTQLGSNCLDAAISRVTSKQVALDTCFVACSLGARKKANRLGLELKLSILLPMHVPEKHPFL